MSQLHFIGGEKGGVGKTVTARLLAQYFIDQKQQFIGFDTELANGAFTRFYRDFTAPAPIDSYESLDKIAEVFDQQPNHYVLVDLAARTSEPLARWVEESDLFGLLADMNVQPYFWHVMENGADSVNLLDKLLNAYGDQTKYVLVLNEGRSESFEIFEHSEVRQHALDMGAEIMRLPRLHQHAMAKVDRNNASFWAAIHNAEPPSLALSLMERRRVKIWLEKAYTLLNALDFAQSTRTDNEVPVNY